MKNLHNIPIAGVILLLNSGMLTKTLEANEQPNVVFIYADDLGRGLLSSEGQQVIATPNIDKLSSSGVRFENAYGSMYCAPARASLLTGYHDCQTDKRKISNGGIYKSIKTSDTLNHTMIQNDLNAQYGEVPGDEVFLAEVFKQAGYVTG